MLDRSGSHVNEYGAVLDAHPRVVNRQVRDSSKRRVSRNLVRPGDGWEGPVIVKTDRNHGGLPEADTASALRGLFARAVPRLRRILAPRALGRARNLEPYRYPGSDEVGGGRGADPGQAAGASSKHT